MSDSEDRSASGIPLLRHREQERNVEVAEGDEALDAAVCLDSVDAPEPRG